MHIEESKRVLRNTQLFQDLNDSHLDLILMICEEKNCRAGEVIFHQDDPGAALYIVARGEVEIYLEPEQPGDEPVQLAILEENATFGETILVEAGRRSAGARSHTDAQLLRIPRQQMVKLMSDYPEIGFRILRRMAADLTAKLRSANEQIRDRQ
ncbi:MAG: cyclic nucleotide-binding domain-containing protein [Anaerolineae bacterium]